MIFLQVIVSDWSEILSYRIEKKKTKKKPRIITELIKNRNLLEHY